ncbi:SprB repeat-containing protein [Haloflavibacter putidus]
MVRDVSCNGATDGTIDVTLTGGTACKLLIFFESYL